jgi:hypothetical protein
MHNAKKMYECIVVKLHAFFSSALDRSCHIHISVPLPLREEALYTVDRRMCGPTAGLSIVGNSKSLNQEQHLVAR